MKMGKLVEALPALQKLAAAELTPKTLYWISKLMSKIDKELAFFNEQRDKALAELGTEIEPGKWKIDPDKRSAFEERMTELANIEIDETLKVVKLPMTENVSLSYNDLRSLEGLVELDFVEDSE